MEKQLQLSVVILCYRAEDFVRVFVSRMKETVEKLGVSYELVLVANYHSGRVPPDRTPEVAKELAKADPRIVVVAKPKKGMMGWDMRSGLDAAMGEVVAVIDGDGQMPPEDVVRVYQKLTSASYDMAKTYREARGDGFIRRIISVTYNLLLMVLFPKVRVRDANSKPKIFTQSALRRLQLTSSSWFIDAEIVIQASELGFSIGEVPTIFHSNPNRTSFIRASSVIEFFFDLIIYRIKTLWQKIVPRSV